MKNELEMTLSSRHPLTESAARDQIAALSEFGDGLMKPDKCSEVEPIITSFEPSDIRKYAQRLAQTHGSFFYRKGRPVHMSGQMWNRLSPPEAPFPSPLFSNIGLLSLMVIGLGKQELQRLRSLYPRCFM